MSELDWKPLANPGKHKPPWCDDCNDYCGPADGPCPVCFGCCGGFPVPEIECCGRGPACGACDDPEPVPQCGATFNEHRCTLDKDHEGWHQEWVERLVDTATWQDAPEVPEWRALVDAVDLKGYQYSTPLAADEDGLPECQNGDCRCTVHSMGGGDTGLPIGEAVTGEWTRCHDQACIRECEEGCCSGVISALTIERDVLREKVQRVERLLDRCDQDTYDFHWGEGSPVVLTQYVRDALDGGEPDE